MHTPHPEYPLLQLGLGIAESCFEHALNHVKKREAFGQLIVNFQSVQFMLAELAADIEAVKRLIYHAAEIASSEDVSVMAAMAKLKSAELAKRAADMAVELYGGYGILWNALVDRAYRDAKTLQRQRLMAVILNVKRRRGQATIT